jgi:hypothetical protein
MRRIDKQYSIRHRQLQSQNLGLNRRAAPSPYRFDESSPHDRSRPFMRAVTGNPDVFIQSQDVEWLKHLSEEDVRKLQHVAGTDQGVRHFLTVWLSDGSKLDIGWDAKDRISQLKRYISRIDSEISEKVEAIVKKEKDEVEKLREGHFNTIQNSSAQAEACGKSLAKLHAAKISLSQARVKAHKSKELSELVEGEFVFSDLLTFT